MSSNTLIEAVRTIVAGVSYEVALADCADAFDLATTDAARYAMIEDAPSLTGEQRIDALVGAMAEYLAKQNKLTRVPSWAASSRRSLDRPWHTSSPFINWKREQLTDGMREYLTFASPAEFASRNIFTEERPLRRARSTSTRNASAR